MSRRASLDDRQGRLALDLFCRAIRAGANFFEALPPLRPGDRVRFIYDRDHIEVVESCDLIAGPVPHWQVVTTWNGNRRIADAAEFVIEEVEL